MMLSVNHTDASSFGKILNQVLSPSKAIDDPRHLKGRGSALRETAQALSADGRQVFVHGFRGVGKSSVALTAAKAHSSYALPTLVYCSATATFASLIRNMTAKALGIDPLQSERSEAIDVRGSAGLPGIGAQGGRLETKKYVGVPEPSSVNDAADMLKKVSHGIDGSNHVFVIDEFDLLRDENSHHSFGELVKLIADSNIPVKLIFCGVAKDLDQIFKAHGSTFRYFHPLKLETLRMQACLDIIEDAESVLDVKIEHNSKIRIVQICDGFPYFVHLITEKLFWRWFNDPEKRAKETSPRHYELALADACSAAEPELRQSYEAITKRYKSDGDIMLWALADGNSLEKNLDSLVKDFDAIYDRIPENKKPDKKLNRSQLSSRMAKMRSSDGSSILSGNGRGWYEFTEKRMRGYARLRAASQGVYLRSDHPLG